MPVIHIPRGLAVAQVEVPTEVVGKDGQKRPVERSCKGSVHLRPGIKMVTNDELAVISKALPKVFRRLRVVSEAPAEKKAREVRVVKAAPVPPPPPPAPPVSEPVPEEPRRSKRGRKIED